jgi:hypothetical protein
LPVVTPGIRMLDELTPSPTGPCAEKLTAAQ